ncbi:esterase [Acerihabitans sp. TG2]|uniref:esterase n=1 Tax=Acerihabitans sp. TG2 TaxID=3096008 RepID=UPI002B234A43|nr:esterase [Acerihabitans sp. TG2]MEA9393089.1 esterase [Acerihabitans sp. TG2]
MVEMHQETVDGIEVIHAVPAGRHSHPLPTVFFYHGFTSSKEVYSYFGYALAKAGFRVILPDAAMHGARFDGDQHRRLSHFWDILRCNIDELPALNDHYARRGLIDHARVGVCGASLGGMTALGAMARYDWLNVVADFMGAGDYLPLSKTLFPPVALAASERQMQCEPHLAPLAEYEVFHQLDKLANRPLLIWHGEADLLVPVEHSRRLYEALASREGSHQATLLTEPDIGHKITVTALSAAVDFFQAHL